MLCLSPAELERQVYACMYEPEPLSTNPATNDTETSSQKRVNPHSRSSRIFRKARLLYRATSERERESEGKKERERASERARERHIYIRIYNVNRRPWTSLKAKQLLPPLLPPILSAGLWLRQWQALRVRRA